MQDDPKSARPQRRATRDRDRPVGPAPTAASLRAAALAHLARFAATEAGLIRVLDGGIRRWAARAVASGIPAEQVATQAAEAGLLARAAAAGLVTSGVVDDAVYAESRARSLSRGGRSRRAISADLAGHGVSAERVAAALPADEAAELGACVLQARRRRVGPFGDPEAADDPLSRRRALGALARAGFSHDVALRALGLDRETADRMILELRRD